MSGARSAGSTLASAVVTSLHTAQRQASAALTGAAAAAGGAANLVSIVLCVVLVFAALLTVLDALKKYGVNI